MQLPRDVQPLLVGAAPRCLFAGALRLIRAPLGLPQRFPAAPAAINQASRSATRASVNASLTGQSGCATNIANGSDATMSTEPATAMRWCPAVLPIHRDQVRTAGTWKPIAW